MVGAVKAIGVDSKNARSKGKFSGPISLPFLWRRLYHHRILLELRCRTLLPVIKGTISLR